MLRVPTCAVVALLLVSAGRLGAQDDAEGCKDHPLFNRLPDFYIYTCDETQFDLRRFPRGPLELGETLMPNKYKELMGIAVHAESKCQYCRLFHTEAAKLFGRVG